MFLNRHFRFVLFLLISIFSVGLFAQGRFNPRQPLMFKLVIIHNNDGESQLINAGSGQEDFGGVARFKSVVDRIRMLAEQHNAHTIMLSSGDNFLAGPEFNASLALPEDAPYYDARALDLIGYDAICIGNHDFDFGPDVLERFITDFAYTQPTYLSSNLDFSMEPGLLGLQNAGRIASSTVVSYGNDKVGVVGATTPNLDFISSPRNVKVNDDVVGAIQTEVDALTAMGVDKIIVISHLQSLNEDLELAPQLRNVDVMIAGGGDELLANDNSLLIPGDEEEVSGPYPLVAADAEGNDIYIITGPGNYRYVGQLEVVFGPYGEVRKIGPFSGPVRVAGGDYLDAVEPDPLVQEMVVDPVEAYLEDLANNIIGESEVALDARRPNIRIAETNEGNLVADALLWQANQVAASFAVPEAHVGLQNGGGIRNANLIPAGPISELTTFDILPFPNFVCMIPGIPAEQFKEILENAVSRVESVSGRFAQISGFTYVWDSTGTPQELDDDGNVVVPGTRVVDVVLNDGTVIVEDGVVVATAPDINIATIDFLAKGGDQYPYRGAEFTTLGVTYQQALANYIVEDLDGLISAADYPEGGEGRITILDAADTETLDRGYTSIDGFENSVPTEFVVKQNYPNPFNPSTVIRYGLPEAGDVRISVYNAVGEKVALLYDGAQAAGYHEVAFSGSQFSSGVYFYMLEAGGLKQVKKMLLAK